MTEWKQERPSWCLYKDCIFLRRAEDVLCGGELPEPILHDNTPNTHRFCIADDEGTMSYMVNANDLQYWRWIMDALDGKTTSWISRIGVEAYGNKVVC